MVRILGRNLILIDCIVISGLLIAIFTPFLKAYIEGFIFLYFKSNVIYPTAEVIPHAYPSIEKNELLVLKKFENTINLKFNNADVCKETAELILSNMNQSVKPCDNFFQFVCGKYDETPFKPTLIMEKWMPHLNKPIDLIYNVTSESPEYQRKVQQYLYLCLDDKKVERTNNDLKAIMNELGGWPIVPQTVPWDEAKFNWTRTLVKLRRRGFLSDYLFELTISTDPDEEVSRIIAIDSPPNTLHTRYYEERFGNNTYEDYYEFMLRVSHVFGAVKHEQEIKDVHDFEYLLLKYSVSEKVYNERLTISALQAKYPFINWLAYINDILYPVMTVLPSEMVFISDPHYLHEITQLMLDKSRRPSNRTLANYIFWRVFWDSSDHLDYLIRYYFRLFRQGSEFEDRETDCHDYIKRDMDLAMSGMFVKSFFNNQTLKPVTEMAENIRHSFKKVIRKVSWMDHDTKERAVQKIDKIAVNIGYSEKILRESNINKYYKEFSVDHNSYFYTMLNIRRFHFKKKVKSLRMPIEKHDWHSAIGKFMKGNPFYNSINALYVPATAIFYFLYDIEYPNFINYARLGQAIGHGMTQAFDEDGQLFNGDGYRTDWLSDWSVNMYKKKMQCITKQYTNYKVEKPPVGHELYKVYANYNHSFAIGRQTMTKNMADIGGTKIAYHAYTSWLEKNPEKEMHLEKFQAFTPKQMFWISFASMWCEKTYSTEIINFIVNRFIHAPFKVRVLGTVVNLPEFFQDFNCHPDDLMSKMKKCDMWWDSDFNKPKQ